MHPQTAVGRGAIPVSANYAKRRPWYWVPAHSGDVKVSGVGRTRIEKRHPIWCAPPRIVASSNASVTAQFSAWRRYRASRMPLLCSCRKGAATRPAHAKVMTLRRANHIRLCNCGNAPWGRFAACYALGVRNGLKETQCQGEIVRSAIDDSLLVDHDVLVAVFLQKLRQESLKCMILARPFVSNHRLPVHCRSGVRYYLRRASAHNGHEGQRLAIRPFASITLVGSVSSSVFFLSLYTPPGDGKQIVVGQVCSLL